MAMPDWAIKQMEESDARLREVKRKNPAWARGCLMHEIRERYPEYAAEIDRHAEEAARARNRQSSFQFYGLGGCILMFIIGAVGNVMWPLPFCFIGIGVSIYGEWDYDNYLHKRGKYAEKEGK